MTFVADGVSRDVLLKGTASAVPQKVVDTARL
jgi:hypothetical protein